MEGRKTRRKLIITLVGLACIGAGLISGIIVLCVQNQESGGSTIAEDEEVNRLRELANEVIAGGYESEDTYLQISNIYTEQEGLNTQAKIALRLNFISSLLDAELYSYIETEFEKLEQDFGAELSEENKVQLWNLYSFYYDKIGNIEKYNEYQNLINDYYGLKYDE